MLLATFVLLSLALFFFVKTEWFLHSAVHTTGTLDQISSPDGRTGTAFHFYTREGQQVNVVSSVTVRATGMPHPGDRVPVVYDPADPQHAQLALFTWLWLAPAVLGFLGSIFAVILVTLRWLSSP